MLIPRLHEETWRGRCTLFPLAARIGKVCLLFQAQLVDCHARFTQTSVAQYTNSNAVAWAQKLSVIT